MAHPPLSDPFKEDPQGQASHLAFLSGGGEMGRLIRSKDWSKTPLGPVEQWPQSLKTAVRIMLTSRQPIWLGWGEHLIKLYNDPYKAIVRGKHPAALGQPAAIVWKEIWPEIGPMLKTAMGGIKGTYVESQLLIMERNGYPEETYYTFSYSPIPDDQGDVGGIFCANTDDTARVIGERQLALLKDLASRTAHARTFEDACRLSAVSLHNDLHDFPFALIYSAEPDSNRFVLAAAGGIDCDHKASAGPRLDEASVWPLEEVIRTQHRSVVSDLPRLFDHLPTGAWKQPPYQAVVVPIVPSDRTRKAGVLIAGLNPFRLFDDNYQRFVDLVVGQIAAGIANAQRYEEERKRAEALAELDQAKTAFFSNISHELRTPLTLMLGPLEELKAEFGRSMSSLDAAQYQQVELVHRNGLRLLKLVNQLLDFSRIEAGRMQAGYEETDLAAFTSELASVFRSAIEKAGLSLIVDCPPLAKPVWVDRDMWEKMVFNLLSNAFKFTYEGEIEVGLKAYKCHAVLTVRDTGTGIPEDQLDKVFERFHRVPGSRGRTHEGTGIGLSLIQELARLHGGSVSVESRYGKGSTFTVTIPFGTAHLAADRIGIRRQVSAATGVMPYLEEALHWLPGDNSAELHVPSPEARIHSLSAQDAGLGTAHPRPRVLLADDNADMRQYARRLLSSQGYEVETVADGQTALEAARNRPPDLVLTDVMMPKLDGFGLLRALRGDPATKTIPVILLSARAGEESRVEGLEQGADDYLIKPFSARELTARVDTHVKMVRMRRDAQAALQESEARFRNMADTAPAMLWVTEPDGSCSFLSQGWYEFTGQTEPEGIGQDGFGWLDALHPDDHKQAGRIFFEANEQHRPFSFEYRLRRHDGEYRWAIDTGHPRWGPNGEFLGYIGSVLDITERKRAEVALRESEAKYRTIFNSIDEGFCIVDMVFDEQGRPHDYRFIEINPVFEQLTGLSNPVGRTARELVPGLEQFWVETYGRVALTGEAVRFEHHAESMKRWFNVYASRVRGETPSHRVVIIFTDITERKRAEETERRAAARDAFRVSLTDTLRPLTDSVAIQAAAGRVVGERLGANRVAYFEVRGTDYFVARDYTNGVPGLAGGYPIASFGPRMLAVYRSGQTACSRDVPADTALPADERAAYAALQIGAYIGVPLIKGGEFVAGLAVHTVQPRDWTPDDIALTEETAERTWAAVERARAEEALCQSREQLAEELAAMRHLQAVSTELIRDDKEEALHDRILDAAMEIMRSDFASLQRLYPERGQGGELRLLACRGYDRAAAEFWTWVRADSGCTCGMALRTGRRAVAADVRTCEFMAGSADGANALRLGMLAMQSTPLISRSGKPVGMISTHWKQPHTPSERDLRLLDVLARQAADLIERKQAAQALHDSEQQTKRARDHAEATLRTSPVPLLVLEKDLRVHTANEAFYHMFQVNPAETQCRLVYELGNGQWNIPKLRELLERILPRNTVFTEFEVTHDFESIGRRTMLLNARRMENEPDVPDRIVLVIEDISERKAIQERLRSFTKELEAQVEDRTRDLVQSQNRLRAMATELNLAEQRERKRLATELHDHLQQTLVLGKLTLVQCKRTGVLVPAGLEVMNKIDDIFTEALTYTRTLVADLSPPVLRDHGLPAGLKWLGEYMKKHEMTVTVFVPEKGALKLPEDQAVLLFQSVRELLINSSKHAGIRQADVRLEWGHERLRIEVSDHGVGFDLAAVVLAVAETPSGGISSKFGLFSIQERMRALGGHFNIQSAPGEGTTATLTLPLRNRIEDTVLNVESSATARTASPSHSAFKQNAPIRILLVDDHPMVRQGLRSIVAAYDHFEVIGEASDGVEALELAQQLDPNVVVMDINMPKMDGIEATRRIKANQPTTVVIGLSVNQSADTEQKMKTAGAAAYLTKESAVDALCHAIEQAVSYKQHKPAPPVCPP